MRKIVNNCARRVWQYVNNGQVETIDNEAQMIASGWDKYASQWNFSIVQGSPIDSVRYLGDEWTAEGCGRNTYGLNRDQVGNFEEYINEHLLRTYLPSSAMEGLEIGPGGGRLTALLLNITKTLHVADPSKAMLQHLKNRFANVSTLRYHQTDGMTLPALPPASQDYVIAFDVFVHFEPRLIYWYLRQIAELLRPGGTAVIHYSNVLAPLGWQQFEHNLKRNVQERTQFGAFGVMCPQLMDKFLESLELDIVSSDVGVIPRDAVAVFRKPLQANMSSRLESTNQKCKEQGPSLVCLASLDGC
jgi:SAM-dependent methyltransferase